MTGADTPALALEPRLRVSYISHSTSVATSTSAAISSTVNIAGLGWRASRARVAVAAASGITGEYAQWSTIGEKFKLDNIQQLVKLDPKHQYTRTFTLYSNQSMHSVSTFSTLGLCLICIVEHELAQSSKPHIPLFHESGFLCSFEQGMSASSTE